MTMEYNTLKNDGIHNPCRNNSEKGWQIQTGNALDSLTSCPHDRFQPRLNVFRTISAKERVLSSFMRCFVATDRKQGQSFD